MRTFKIHEDENKDEDSLLNTNILFRLKDKRHGMTG